MYPGTIFNWYDQSAIRSTTPAVVENGPLFLTMISSDKGPEDLRVVHGQTFFNLYGSKPSFNKHGQPAIQAANIINNGGTLLIKRLVANDATLANTILVATITSNVVATPAEDDNADAKTLDEIKGIASESTTTETKYTTESNTILSWTAVSLTGAKHADEIRAYAETLSETHDLTDEGVDIPDGVEVPDGGVFLQSVNVIPVVVVSDNGRGVSNKSVRFIPDYTTSRDTANFYYNVRVFEGTTIVETQYASLNPYASINNVNYGISPYNFQQIVTLPIEGAYEKLLNVYEKATGLTREELKGFDLIYATNNRKVGLPGISIDTESIDLDSKYGVSLENGSNGAFGNAPFGTEAYENAAAWCFYPVSDDTESTSEYDYENSDIIFDVDEYKIAACFDANYPRKVKDAIAKLATFREDFVYFRDFGLNIGNFASINSMADSFSINNRYIANYCTTYQIFNPYDSKRIRVTMMYDFAAAMVNHFVNGPYRPLAGLINDMVLPSAIEGTVNFTPRITPVVNQKDLLDQIRVNYASFNDGQCIVQSLYTSQSAYTQLSYVNNVLGIQQVVRAVRTACPKFRYTFVNGNDFSDYADAVTNVLSNFVSNFNELSFGYQQDDILADNKIFYGVLYFRFNNWAQTEVFDIYALPTETTSEE